ncbi:CpsB/CapC family capsule biosynthesis tyrosine phosphatase [Priestia filamentosa]|uniref:CpsB/CapC family capsule biosynthesis tyrosine phosphatase n=1 Tax=Priestia filamentosa TaxID=1402861 RepID=UPI0020A6AABB|nr:CpsB/CapC family capsule biosynthesis tyrosine phosphatase [Priestia filamentosa]
MIDTNCLLMSHSKMKSCSNTEMISNAREMIQEGIKSAIVVVKNEEEALSVKELNRLLVKESLPLKLEIISLCEMNEALFYEVKQGNVYTLGKRESYVYIDYAVEQSQFEIEKILYDLQIKGIVPIIPNPETMEIFQSQPNLFYKYIKKGALSQISIASLLGKNGRKAKKFAVKFLNANLADLVGTAYMDEYISLQEGYDLIAKKIGESTAIKLQRNASSILVGESIIREEPERISSKRLFIL